MARLPVIVKKTILIAQLCTIFLILVLVCFGCSSLGIPQWIPAGSVRISSGFLLISDPSFLPEILDGLTVKVDVPPGTYEVKLLQADSGNWGQRIMQARVLFSPQAFKNKRKLGSVSVDSATLAVVDPENLRDEWVEVGPRRDGIIIGVDKDEIAELLQKNGFRVGEHDEWSITLANPVSKDDENQIELLIESNDLKGTLLVKTGNSFDQITEKMTDNTDWAELSFADGHKGFVVAFPTGLGDGEYPVYGLYNNTTLVGLEIDFDSLE